MELYTKQDLINLGVDESRLEGYQRVNPFALPSAHQIGDRVFFSLNGNLIPAEVYSPRFYEGKVKYDIIVEVEYGGTQRLYNIDSAFLQSAALTKTETIFCSLPMPAEVYLKGRVGTRQEGFNPAGIPVEKLTETEAMEFAENLKYTFLNHWRDKTVG